MTDSYIMWGFNHPYMCMPNGQEASLPQNLLDNDMHMNVILIEWF